MKRDEQRVFPGSLNLLPPSDKAPNDAIALQNFRVDQSGVLRGGDTFQVLCNVGAAIHTIVKLQSYSVTQPQLAGVWQVNFGVDGAYLIGAGTSLYFYWPDGGAAAGPTAIATGLSGNPLSILLWNGFVWLLDSLKQLKINPLILSAVLTGAAVSTWLPALPATAITAAAYSGSSGGLSGTYQYFCTYFVYTAFSGGTQYTNVETAGGPGVTAVASGGAISIVGLPIPNVFVDQIRVYRSGGTLTTKYLVNTFAYPFDYPSVSQPWTDTQTDATLAASGTVMPTSSGTGAPATPTQTASVVPGYALSDATAMVGTYYYYATFVNSAGLETNPGPVSQAVTPTVGAVQLSAIPVSSDSDVVKRRIYREGGELGSAYQVVELEDNTTTTYLDRQTDLALEELGILMPTTNDPPPAGVATDNVGVVGPYFNQLLAWKNNKLYWSQDGVPLFPGSEDGEPTGNWVNVGESDEKIQTITLHARLAAIYKERTVWRLLGDVVTGTLEQTAATCGALSKTSVAVAGSADLMLSKDGLYLFNLDSAALQSERISPVFVGKQWIQFGASDIAQPSFFPGGYTVRGLAAFLNGTALIGNCVSGAGITAQFLMSLGGDGSVRCAQFLSHLGNYAITAALSWGSQWLWYAGDSAGNLLGAVQQAQSGQQLIWQTPFLDQGTGDAPKSYQEIVIDAELQGATATVYIFYDNSGAAGAKASATTFTLSGTNRKKFYLALEPTQTDSNGTTGDDLYPHISVRIEINCTATGVSPAIHALYIYYTMEERDAAVRGSQLLDFHSERIALCKKMEVDAVGQVDIAIWTDLPGGIAQRMVYAAPATTTRGIFEFPLQPNIRGRLWRIDVLPQNTTARVYAVRGWMREIGLAGPGEWGWRDFIAGADAETPDAE